MKRTLVTLVCLCFIYWSYGQAHSGRAHIDQVIADGQAALDNTKYDIADSLARVGLVLAKTNNYPQAAARCEHLLGEVAFRQENFPEADACYFRALHIWETIADPIIRSDSIALGILCRDIATIKGMNDNFTSQCVYAERGLKIFQGLHEIRWEGELSIDLANAHKDAGEPLKAEKHYRQAAEIFSSTHDDTLIAVAHYGLGDLYYQYEFEQYTLDSALSYVQKAIPYFQDQEEPLIQAYNLRAAIEKELGRIEAASASFARSAALAESGGYVGQHFDALVNLTSLEIEQGRYPEANAYYQQAEEVLASKTKVDKQEMTYLDQVGADLRALGEKRNRRLLSILGILLFSYLIMGGGIWMTIQRQRQRKERERHARQMHDLWYKIDDAAAEAREEGSWEERQRIKKNVHNEIGSQLAATRWRVDNLMKDVNGQIGLKEELHTIWQMIDQAFQDSRNIERSLDRTTPTWYNDIEMQFAFLQKNYNDSKPLVRFEATEFDEYEFTAEQGRAIKQIIRIATANTLLFAQADNYTCQLNQLDDELLILIEDDGVGFDTRHTPDGTGLANLQDLVTTQLKGQVRVDSKPGQGTTISITIPLNL